MRCLKLKIIFIYGYTRVVKREGWWLSALWKQTRIEFSFAILYSRFDTSFIQVALAMWWETILGDETILWLLFRLSVITGLIWFSYLCTWTGLMEFFFFFLSGYGCMSKLPWSKLVTCHVTAPWWLPMCMFLAYGKCEAVFPTHAEAGYLVFIVV